MAAEAALSQKKMEVNRREFLNLAWLVSLGFFSVSLAGVSYLFSLPRFREGEFGGEIKARLFLNGCYTDFFNGNASRAEWRIGFELIRWF